MSFKQMIKRFLVELFDKKHHDYVAQQQQQALRSLQQISFWMQESLFISLQYSNYPFLQSFRAVQNIRPAGYSFKNNWYIFLLPFIRDTDTRPLSAQKKCVTT